VLTGVAVLIGAGVGVRGMSGRGVLRTAAGFLITPQ